jgi:SAM-dependent methyltransferase
MAFEGILEKVGAYYGAKLTAHGANAQGVDWNSEDSQRLRFRELLTVCDRSKRFSLNDVGCGYGALLDYLAKEGFDVEYRGYDIAAEMIASAQQIHPNAYFCSDKSALKEADYSVCSGIFNVRLTTPEAEWKDYVLHTIEELAAISRSGFSFNMLTSYSDRERMRGDLYYGDPCFFFDLCKRRYSRHVALLHDYGLYEFTIVVRK